jgi:hypothetical protein
MSTYRRSVALTYSLPIGVSVHRAPDCEFQFGDDYVAFSIETRKEVGESYSAVLGFFANTN